jgi:hypothetical protein
LAPRGKAGAGQADRLGRGAGTWGRTRADAASEEQIPDVPYQLVLTFVALAALKVLIEIPLGVSIVVAQPVGSGLSPLTYAWRVPLGLGLLASALLAGLGGYATYYLQNLGAALLSASFAIDALLLVWLLVALQSGRLVVWPGVGPYLLLFILCVLASVYLGVAAVRRRLL